MIQVGRSPYGGAAVTVWRLYVSLLDGLPGHFRWCWRLWTYWRPVVGDYGRYRWARLGPMEVRWYVTRVRLRRTGV